jgi:energy-coupling factor transporter ATP-binding protein EcfA2
MMKIPSTYPLYESYNSQIPIEQLFVHNFNKVPSKYYNGSTFDEKIITLLVNLGFNEIINITTKRRKYDNEESSRCFYNEKKEMFITLAPLYLKSNSYTLEIIYGLENGVIENQIDFKLLNTTKIKKKKANINLIKSVSGHLDIEEYELITPDIDLSLNYGKDFVKVFDTMVKRLNTDYDKGIILLHGLPGCGKTMLIKYLTGLIETKEILFVPPSMVDMLSEPSIIPFLMEYKNSILLIEDGEKIITARGQHNSSSAGVSNVLNLTDGFLGDCLNIQIIVTFNMDRSLIDDALLRPGRLIAEHKFDKLSIDDCNRLLKKLKKDYVATEKMTLADIYNIDVEQFKVKNTRNKIGITNK